MPTGTTIYAHSQTREAYYRARNEYALTLERMAAEAILELFEKADSVVLQGEDSYDSGPILRIQRILDNAENVLWDVEDPDEDFEDQLSEIEHEFLDALIDITGDDWYGENSLDIGMKAST